MASTSFRCARRQLLIAFGHFDVCVAEEFSEFVKIAAVHHVEGGKVVTQIVEAEILDASFFGGRF
jgi:hypothetical protein